MDEARSERGGKRKESRDEEQKDVKERRAEGQNEHSKTGKLN